MKKTLVLSALILGAFAACSSAIPPPRMPLPKPVHEEPDLLTEYERKTLTLEMNNLIREIGAARALASEDPSLEALKKDLAEAKTAQDPEKTKTAERSLGDAVETLLYKQEGMPAKIKRLLDVGNLLRYDTPEQKESRRRKGTAFEQTGTGK
jgi:hypothetical protein